MKKLIAVLPLVLMFIIFSADCFSQELTIMGGPIINDSSSSSERSASVMLEYSQKIQGLFFFSAAYLNEGHFNGHHRDGFTVQGWIRTTDISNKLSLGLGIGPYLYFDTRFRSDDDHGLGAIASLDAQWSLSDRWYLDIRTSYVVAPQMRTMPILFGVGYKFDSLSTGRSSDKNEFNIFIGDSIVNNSGEKAGFAKGVEYRRKLLDHMDLTVSYLNEGNNERVQRQGIATQLWATQKVSDRIDVGIGGGLYEAHDKYRDSTLDTNGIITMTGSYRLYDNWFARVSWGRIVSNYDKDSDLILVGLGYKF
jgi:putative salt-induced outer membrane protein YdiY